MDERRSGRDVARTHAQADSSTDDAERFLHEASESLTVGESDDAVVDGLTRVLVPRLADAVILDIHDEGTVHTRVGTTPGAWDMGLKLRELMRRHPAPREGHTTAWLRGANPSVLGHLPEEATAAREPILHELVALGFFSAVSVPVTLRGQSLGSLVLLSAAPWRTYDHADLQLGTRLAHRLALVLENLRLRREAQRALELISIASHELRSPLGTLRLNLHLLHRAWSSGGEKPRVFDTAARQLDRMDSVVDRLLDVTRIRSGRLVLRPVNVDLCTVVTEALARLEDDRTRAGCVVLLDLPSTLQGYWDRDCVEYVVINLLGNAFKYGAGLPVDMVLEATDDGARLIVRDRGVGIRPEDHTRVFGRFERASQRQPGLGLGLWIVRKLVDALGGDIHLASDVGRGATFTVDLPRGADAPVTAPASRLAG
ncbi:MAG: GAF domain-containing sensor histidine kinase [Myxococcota bacterium]